MPDIALRRLATGEKLVKPELEVGAVAAAIDDQVQLDIVVVAIVEAQAAHRKV